MSYILTLDCKHLDPWRTHIPPPIISDLVLDIQKVTLYEMNKIMIELRSSSHEAPSPNRRVLLTNTEEWFPFPCSQLGASFCRGFHIPQGLFLLNSPWHQLFFLHSHCPEVCGLAVSKPPLLSINHQDVNISSFHLLALQQLKAFHFSHLLSWYLFGTGKRQVVPWADFYRNVINILLQSFSVSPSTRLHARRRRTLPFFYFKTL